MLKLIIPKLEDLWFRQEMLEDETTMSYNHHYGGTISFPRESWEDWFNRWVNSSDDKHFYRYVVNDNGEFVGEVAYRYDEEIEEYIANVIIHSKYRGRGYGSEALELLCENAKHNGVATLYDDVAIDNPAIKMFLTHGFKEESRDSEKIYLKKIL